MVIMNTKEATAHFCLKIELQKVEIQVNNFKSTWGKGRFLKNQKIGTSFMDYP